MNRRRNSCDSTRRKPWGEKKTKKADKNREQSGRMLYNMSGDDNTRRAPGVNEGTKGVGDIAGRGETACWRASIRVADP